MLTPGNRITKMNHCSIILLGNRPRTTSASFGDREGYRQATKAGAVSTYIVRIMAPSNAQSNGFGEIKRDIVYGAIQAEGLLLQRAASAAFLQTADCPTVIIENLSTGSVLVTHAGRPALTPQAGENIVTKALAMIAPDNETAQLQVHLAGGISGRYFSHEQAPELARPFLDAFGPTVFTDTRTLALDLIAVITQQLTAAGLSAHQINHDGHCTFQDPALASHRELGPNREVANTIVVVKH